MSARAAASTALRSFIIDADSNRAPTEPPRVAPTVSPGSRRASARSAGCAACRAATPEPNIERKNCDGPAGCAGNEHAIAQKTTVIKAHSDPDDGDHLQPDQ